MALDGTYSGLKASVADFLWRPDLAATIPDFIRMAEVQMQRRFVVDGAPREMQARSQTLIESEFVQTPPDMMNVRAMYLVGETDPLRYVDPEVIVQNKQLYNYENGKPRHYSIVGNEFQFWPWVVGDASYTAELTFNKLIPSLIEYQSNWLLIAHPDAYLYGALVQAAPYLRDDDRIGTWGTIYAQIMGDITAAAKAAKTTAHLAPPIRFGGTP